MRQPNLNRIRPTGFTLIEVLIALLIFGLGVLGVTALTSQSQKISHHAYQSMVATWQLHDMMELIRANATEARDNSNYIYALGDTVPGDPGCINSGCSAAQMADYDLNLWLNAASDRLPSGQGSVSKAASSYTLTLHWDGNRVGTGATTNCPNSADTDLMCQQLRFDL